MFQLLSITVLLREGAGWVEERVLSTVLSRARKIGHKKVRRISRRKHKPQVICILWICELWALFENKEMDSRLRIMGILVLGEDSGKGEQRNEFNLGRETNNYKTSANHLFLSCPSSLVETARIRLRPWDRPAVRRRW